MRRVVIFVFDGLQAELVTPELMPNLHAFARGGARLLAHQPVFPTVTRVNATSMVTGSFPGRHGLSGNMSVFPEFDPARVVNAMEPEFRELLASDVPVLLAPTLAEVLADHGLEYIATGIGSTGQSFVHHPRGDSLPLGASIHPEYTIPGPLSDEIERRFGPWPAAALPNSARIDRLIEVVTEYVIAERDAAVSLLWCSEPDSSQHASRLGSPRVHEAARAADAGFGRLLAWLRERRLADQTNVIVTCDHGHSTVSEVIPVRELLLEAGFAPPGSPAASRAPGTAARCSSRSPTTQRPSPTAWSSGWLGRDGRGLCSPPSDWARSPARSRHGWSASKAHAARTSRSPCSGTTASTSTGPRGTHS